MSEWESSPPLGQGWYFWKRNRNYSKWLWQAYFVMNEGHNISYLLDGTAMDAPRGGWWRLIELDDDTCAVCGRGISKGATYCADCYM